MNYDILELATDSSVSRVDLNINRFHSNPIIFKVTSYIRIETKEID